MRGCTKEGYDLSPSQLFRRQCYLNAWYDPVARSIAYIGPKDIVWSTNMPQATSTWPRTRETIERCFTGLRPKTASRCSGGTRRLFIASDARPRRAPGRSPMDGLTLPAFRPRPTRGRSRPGSGRLNRPASGLRSAGGGRSPPARRRSRGAESVTDPRCGE